MYLLLALLPTQCAALPGFGGSLILQPPGLAIETPLVWSHVYVKGPVSYSVHMGEDAVVLPPGLPPGFQFVMQTLADDWPNPWSFSNAVLVTVR